MPDSFQNGFMTPLLRSWLVFFHRWVGYPTGLILFILFFTGTLATFSAELQQWMEPRTALHVPLTEQGLSEAQNHFAQALRQTPNSFLRLPTQRDPVIRLWHFNGHSFLGPALDPSTGAIIPMRTHVGGTFFIMLHDTIHLPVFYGALIGIFASIGLFLALITGVWIHLRRFLPDLLLFRPQSSPRRYWLDVHLLTGCTVLPAIIVISFSGALLDLHRLGLISPHHTHKTAPLTKPHTLPPLIPMFREGQEKWGDLEGAFFLNTSKGIRFTRGDEVNFCANRPFITIEGASMPIAQTCKMLPLFHAIHNMRWAHNALRWLYGLTGLVGALLVGSGLILFERKERQNIRNAPYLQRLYQTLNNGTLVGLPFATFGLLAASRLPAPSFMTGDQWEIACFFCLWGGCYGLAFLSNARYALLPGGLAIAGLGIMPLDLLTKPASSSGWALCLTIDSCAALTGLAGLFIALSRREKT